MHPIKQEELLRSEAQTANVQSFMLWQQATIETACHNHSFTACLHHIYMGVVLRAHPVHGEPHIQCNANGEVATQLKNIST